MTERDEIVLTIEGPTAGAQAALTWRDVDEAARDALVEHTETLSAKVRGEGVRLPALLARARLGGRPTPPAAANPPRRARAGRAADDPAAHRRRRRATVAVVHHHQGLRKAEAARQGAVARERRRLAVLRRRGDRRALHRRHVRAADEEGPV